MMGPRLGTTAQSAAPRQPWPRSGRLGAAERRPPWRQPGHSPSADRTSRNMATPTEDTDDAVRPGRFTLIRDARGRPAGAQPS